MKIKQFIFTTLFLSGTLHISIAYSQSNVSSQASSTDPTIKNTTTTLVDSVSKHGMSASAAVKSSSEEGINKWLAINGEGLYNTKPWRITGEGATMTSNAAYTSTDFRFTTKGDVMYVFVMDIPQRDMLVKSLACTADNKPIKTVTLLGSKERISWEQRERELLIEKPDMMPSENVIAFKITFQEYYQAPPLKTKIVDGNKAAQ